MDDLSINNPELVNEFTWEYIESWFDEFGYLFYEEEKNNFRCEVPSLESSSSLCK